MNRDFRFENWRWCRKYASSVFMRKLSTGKPSGAGHPVGEAQNQPYQLSFNTSLRHDFQGSRVTSDGCLILIRELDKRLGFDVRLTRRGRRASLSGKEKTQNGIPGQYSFRSH